MCHITLHQLYIIYTYALVFVYVLYTYTYIFVHVCIVASDKTSSLYYYWSIDHVFFVKKSAIKILYALEKVDIESL